MDFGSLADWLSLIVALVFGVITIYISREQLKDFPFSQIKKWAVSIGIGVIVFFFFVMAFQWGRLSGESTIIEVTRRVEVPIVAEVEVTREITREVTRVMPQEVEVPVEVTVEITVPVVVEVTSSAPSTDQVITATPPPTLTPAPTPSFTSYTLDLSSRPVGSAATDLGSDIYVNENGEKYISGQTENGVIRIQDLVLAGKFQIVYDIAFDFPQNTKITTSSANGTILEIYFFYDGDSTMRFDGAEYHVYGLDNFDPDGRNRLILRIDTVSDTGTQAALFVNGDNLVKSQSISPGTIFNTIEISGIGVSDRVYNISATPSE
ncbi:MAG: hypothetical protein KJ063_23925 [Anaerolineae bacterium]|nr:hypothetical protein [Anaerolineae bacterium]